MRGQFKKALALRSHIRRALAWDATGGDEALTKGVGAGDAAIG
jgi:hypothetical protein